MAFELSWDGAPLPDFTSRDRDIAHSAELESDADENQYQEQDDENPVRIPQNQLPTKPLGRSPACSFDPQTGETGERPSKKTSKKRRVPGGIAAISKKLSLDYDSDDGRLIELKKQGYSDEQVSTKFEEEGRMRYAAKTVNSRWVRLRRLLTQQEDERLDDELSDWHEGEVCSTTQDL